MFGLLWRAILWALRMIGYALGALGLIGIVCSFLDKGVLVPGIVMLVIGSILILVTRNRTEKIIAKKMCTCSKCKRNLGGASYRYSYNCNEYNKVYSLIPVDFEITCPHCGKNNFKRENVEIPNISASSEEINAKIESWMDAQLRT